MKVDICDGEKSQGILFGEIKLYYSANLAFAANTFVTTALLTWLPSYFQRVEGISSDEQGINKRGHRDAPGHSRSSVEATCGTNG